MIPTTMSIAAVAVRPPAIVCWGQTWTYTHYVVTQSCSLTVHQLRLTCRNVKVCQSPEQLAALPPGPKAVLATLPSLEAGPAQELFVEWAGDPHSLILFTERPPVRSHPSPAVLILHTTLRHMAPPEDRS